MLQPLRISELPTRIGCYLAILGVSALFLWKQFSELATLAVQDDRYSYTIVVPLISAVLIWLRRSIIFPDSHPSPKIGIPVLAAATLMCFWASQQTGDLWLPIASVIMIWTAGFLLLFGPSSLHAAMFPMLLLWLLVPIPDTYMKLIEIGLQRASGEMAYALFRITGMPVFRQGLTFSLPGVDVQVAEECSGIRSSVSLVIVTLIASQLFLKSGWRQLCLTLVAVPIVIFKNAVRIVALSWLGVYVSPGFFFGDLHHYGGLPFSLLTFVLLIPILLALQASEKHSAAAARSTR